jgi:hypothetical protein
MTPKSRPPPCWRCMSRPGAWYWTRIGWLDQPLPAAMRRWLCKKCAKRLNATLEVSK